MGLAFSGGGIRSATFNLGVTQAFAKSHLLSSIDYLSTVSGGGYIGSWLSSWAYYISKKNPNNQNQIAQIEKELNREPERIGDIGEPRQIHFLRDYSNYLTPRLGILSGDTLAFVATYLRNLFLNQAILISFLLFLLVLPRMIEVLCQVKWGANANTPIKWLTVLVLFLLLGAVCKRIISNTCTRRVDSARAVECRVVRPLFLFCALAAWFFWKFPLELDRQNCLLVIVIAAVVYAFLWWLAIALMPRLCLPENRTSGDCPSAPTSAYLRWAPAVWAAPTGLIAGVFILWIFQVFGHWATRYSHSGVSYIVAFGVPFVTTLALLVGVLHLGLIGRAYEDKLREWWARLGGAVLALALYWLLLSVVTLFVPLWLAALKCFLLNADTGWAARTWKVLSALGIAGAITGWVGATLKGLLAAKGPNTGPQPNNEEAGAKTTRSAADLAARIAPPIFVAGLFILLSWLLYLVLRLFLPNDPRWYTLFAIALALFLVSRFLGWRVDVNEFSLNNAYRNRIVRCYLGATHDDRKPQPFTGFDDTDNIYMAWLKDLGAPFHILNATLNVVKGEELALQARKARSFVFTPLYSGFDYTSEQSATNIPAAPTPGSTAPPVIKTGSYRLTEHCSWKSRYPGARLGTAMAISGAAASPNMGHYTTGAVSFLLAIFCVRLGWWLGNPWKKECWESGGPRSSWNAMINELTGNTTDDQNEVYLSDGGHFENLGIYELIRRRCRVIIACDASADFFCTCNDLASAIEKCRVDFGTEITINLDELQPPAGSPRISPFVTGEINYPGGLKGTLIYIKPLLIKNLPQDVLAYSRLETTFPHQSTIDQFFDEAQFESYRELGFECASAAVARINEVLRA